MSRASNNHHQKFLHLKWDHHLQLQHFHQLKSNNHQLEGAVAGEEDQWRLQPQLEELALQQLRVRTTEDVLPVLQRDMLSMVMEIRTTTSLIPE